MRIRSLTTLALVMDGDHAYVVDISEKGETPVLLHESFQHPPLTSEHGHDKPGRNYQSQSGNLTRHAYPKRHDWHDMQKDLFAKKAADFLNRPERLFDELIVIAPAKILGVLRTSFSKKVSSKIVKELSKDLVNLPMEKLWDYLEGPDMHEPGHKGCCPH